MKITQIEDDILIVDDTPGSLKLLSTILTQAGFKVRAATDGELALRSIELKPPALVLLDIRMPGIDGYEVCRQLKADARTQNISVIFISALENEKDIVKGFQYGGVDYINKPFRQEEVIARVRAHLSLKKIQDELELSNSELRTSQISLEEKVKERTNELQQVNDKLQAEMNQHLNTLHALQVSEEKYRSLVENISDVIFFLGSDGRFNYISPVVEKYTQMKPEEIVGQYFSLFAHPEDLPGLEQQFRDLNAGKTMPFEFRALRKDGSPLYASVISRPMMVDGKMTGVFGVISDITERKIAEEERRKLEEQLAQSQKIESIGKLTGGIAHDFNNLLTVIIGYAEMLMFSVPEKAEYKEDIDQIMSAGKYAKELTQQLLAFSRKQVLEIQTLDVKTILQNIEKLIRRLIGENISVEIHIHPDTGLVNADISQIEQVLMNLCINARDAMPKDGDIIIETKNTVLDEHYASMHTEVTPGNYVQISVSDTGTGMDSETLARIFDPFFTTKEKGKGTGLGLSTVYGIVKQHGGSVSVYSEVDKGTTFNVFLPQAVTENSLLPEQKTTTDISGKGENILVIEDDNQVRRMVCRMLAHLGYNPIDALTPKEGIEYLRQNENIDLLLTDIIMPGTSGKRIAEEAAILKPGIKIVYMSGYTDEVIAHHGILEKNTRLLSKPFSEKKLNQKIQEALNE